MKQTKVLTTIAVATLSTGAGLVHADDVMTTKSVQGMTVAKTDINEVTESQVTAAKVKAEQALAEVKAQEVKVKVIEAEKSQAQQSLVNVTTAISDNEKLASEATSEGIANAKKAVDVSQAAVATSEAKLEEAQAEVTAAKVAVDHQSEIIVKADQEVAAKQAEVIAATKVVEQAKEALTVSNSNQTSDVQTAEKLVDEAAEAVKAAESKLVVAQKADAKHESDVRHAKAELDIKSQELAEKQTALKQVMAAIEAERLTKPVENGTYFNQRDNEWQKAYGNQTFAATGCVPSALAMVFSDLAKREVTPTEVADYLWHNTDEFNKHYGGTSGKGLVAATNHYGFASTHLDSQSTIIAALQAGHHVLAAVQNNKFSPWGPQYSHEIVLRGYSNGNTYVYDPYEKANIGWYPVAKLWNEQSRDAIDTAEVGVPFFKITTQKMAQLEMAKAVANEGLDEAKQAVKQAEANVEALEQVISQKTSQAKEQLAAAKANLVTAKDMLDKAKQTAKLTEQDLETKTANLKQAQEYLTLKQDDLAKAQTVLAAQETSLEQLTKVLLVAQENLGRATKAVEQAKIDLTQKQAYVTNLKQVTKLKQEGQDKLNQAKEALVEVTTRLGQELAILKTLQAKEADVTAQYQTIFKAYQAILAAKQQSQLSESKAKIEEQGEQAIPMVNEAGQVTGYITDIKQAEVLANKQATAATLVVANQINFNSEMMTVRAIKHLPKTGEKVSLLTLMGTSLISVLVFVMRRCKKNC
ncbi:TPA: C39 family peptidase [Streptococcus equi subsp. zooepidemicus]